MRKSVTVLSGALLASVAAAAWLWSELQEEHARNAELAARIAQLQLIPENTASVLAPLRPAAADPTRVTPTDPVASAGHPREIHGQREDWEAYQHQLMRDPKYREARRAQERLAYAPRRANLIRLLGLTPAQADAAIELQLDQDARRNEIYQKDATNDARLERRAQLEALEQAHQDQLRSLLGEEKRELLETYMESRQSRMQVDRLRSDLTEANALRDDQVEPLIAALHAERTQMQGDLQEYGDTLSWEGDQSDSWRRYSERQEQLMKSMNGRMHSSASSILTGAQLDALDDLLKREFARFEAQQRINRLQSTLERPGAAASSSN